VVAERRRLQKEEFLAANSTSLMAANRVESSHRPYDTMLDNNNHPVSSPSLRAGHQTVAPTPVLIDVTPQRHVQQQQPTLNLEDPVDESERKRQRIEVLPTQECAQARARHAVGLLGAAPEIATAFMPETPAVRSHSPITYGRPRHAMLNNETHTRDASHSASSAKQAEGNPSYGCPYRKRNPTRFNLCRHPECASPLRGFPELLCVIRPV